MIDYDISVGQVAVFLALVLFCLACVAEQREAKVGDEVSPVHFLDPQTGNCIRSTSAGRYTHFYIDNPSACERRPAEHPLR
jgi:hypothetical protein